ncbi:MAG: ComF family protein [Oscillospiraceae bacterium]|nr:ComF family protein [Oscillospiraceae bacterium]
MGSLSKKLYLLRRFGNSLFTYNCASCGKAVRGKCLCAECSKKLLPAKVQGEAFSSAYCYDGPAKEVMLCYKFGDNYEFCRDTLCDWLLEGMAKLSADDIDAVVPVPSYKRKTTRLSELTKGFALLAELPCEPKLLRKIRETRKQHNIPYEERFSNLSGAFEADPSVRGKTVLLIDDIYTTGSTVSECSKALLEKGAEKVLVLTVLKTEKKK